MKVTIRDYVDADKILKSRGLGPSNDVNIFTAETVARLADPYVPMSPGAGAHMKDQYQISSDGAELVYTGPYAHFQFVGLVMVGTSTGSPWAKSGEPKEYTNRPLDYSGGPMRGADWITRMLADRRDDLTGAIKKYIGDKKP